MSCQERLFRDLRERGMRVTPQRELVLSVLHDIEGHASAEEIYRRVQVRSTVIDISTVYRTLEMMQALNMLESMEGADGQRRFALRHTHDRHTHLVCSCCGAVIEARLEPLQSLARTLRQQYGFALAEEHITLSGLCAECDTTRVSDDQS
jgi:Fur family ferric uptake transcriptional regulator